MKGKAALFARVAMLALAVFTFADCALIDLRGFPVTTWPAVPEAVVPSAQNVWVQFSEPVDHAVVEPLIAVTAAGQSVAGDFAWNSNQVIFTPVKPFAPGVRHVLSLQGTIRTIAGRMFDERIIVPFYVGTDAPPPIISAVTPAEGAIIGRSATLSLGFSEPMDKECFRDAFSVSPASDFTLAWNADCTTVTISPRERWIAETLYAWSVASACKSLTGVAVARVWSGTFLVQNDPSSPSVLPPGRALVSASLVSPLPGGLSDLLRGDCIMLAFSKDVDLSTLEAAFSLSPAVIGSLRKVSAGIFVFVPAEDWRMGQEYVLTITTDLEDLAGNPLPSPFRQVFTPAIPAQTVCEIDLVGNLTDTPVYATSALNNSVPYLLHWTVGAPPDDALALTITLRFSEPYDDAHKPIIAGAIRLDGFFPESVISPQVTQVGWTGPRTVNISYTGFTRSADSPSRERIYYRLSIPSGPEQTGTFDGSFLSDPVTLLLESGSDS